jgi:hypothetical protein
MSARASPGAATALCCGFPCAATMPLPPTQMMPAATKMAAAGTGRDVRNTTGTSGEREVGSLRAGGIGSSGGCDVTDGEGRLALSRYAQAVG